MLMHMEDMLSPIVFIIVLLPNAVLCARMPCKTETGNLPNPNACADARDSDDCPLPNCMNIGTSDLEADAEWVCSECSHNCDCAQGKYCPKGPGQFSGTCRDIGEDARLGHTCIIFGIPGTPGALVPILGVDDLLVCGSPIFNKSGEFVRYDWIGSCNEGKCEECSGGLLSWIIQTSTIDYDTTAVDVYDRTTFLGRDRGTIMCAGSYCRSGSVARGGSWAFELLPQGALVAILVFVMFIFFIMCFGCICKCCRDRRLGQKFIPQSFRAIIPVRHARSASSLPLAEQADFTIDTQNDASMQQRKDSE